MSPAPSCTNAVPFIVIWVLYWEFLKTTPLSQDLHAFRVSKGPRFWDFLIHDFYRWGCMQVQKARCSVGIWGLRVLDLGFRVEVLGTCFLGLWDLSFRV